MAFELRAQLITNKKRILHRPFGEARIPQRSGDAVFNRQVGRFDPELRLDLFIFTFFFQIALHKHK